MKSFDDFLESQSPEEFMADYMEGFRAAAESSGIELSDDRASIGINDLPVFLATLSHQDTLRTLRRYHEWLGEAE